MLHDDPGARRQLVRLCAIGLLGYCSYAICRAPLLPLLARELGADAPTVGLIVGASTVTGILVKLPAGTLSDVLGRRPLLVAGTALFAAMPFTYLGLASLGMLMALRVVHGAATAIVGPVASASLSDLAPSNRRGTWFSTYSTVQGVGQSFGVIIAGYLVASGRYDLAFLTAGTIALATPVLAAGWTSGVRAPARSVSLGGFAHAIVDVGRQPLILVTSLAQAAQFVLNGTLNAFLPLFAHDELGLDPSTLGWLFALQTITTLAARPVIGVLSDRVHRRGVIVLGLALCCGAALLISTATGLSMLVVAIISYAIGVAVTTTATSAFITDLTRGSRYGTAHGVFGTIYDVGDALGPIAAGFLVASVGYARMFQIMAAVVFAVGTVFYVAARRARSEG